MADAALAAGLADPNRPMLERLEPGASRIAFAWPVTPSGTASDRGRWRTPPSQRGTGDRLATPRRRHAAPILELATAPRAAAPAGRARLAHRGRRARPSPGDALRPLRLGAAVEEIPAPDQHAALAYERMRVVVADPPAFTPPYDHALAAALAEAGADVELVTSRFRFGDVAAPDGYRRRELFYPLSSRLFGRSRLRVPLKVVEHPLGLARLPPRRRTSSTSSGWRCPSSTRGCCATAPRSCSPHTTSCLGGPRRRPASGAALFGRFERIVVHSQRGRETLAAFGVPEEKLRVIPHPVTPSDPQRADDGRTVLALGLVRPYKQLTTLARRSSASGSATPGRRRCRASCRRPRSTAALGESTVAVFPYRAELDQSGALLRALGAGLPGGRLRRRRPRRAGTGLRRGPCRRAGRRRRARRRDRRAARRRAALAEARAGALGRAGS